jgi:gamma-glutamyltranspeptidase
MSDCTIRTASDVYGFVAQLKSEAEKHGNIDFASELDDAVHLGSSGLEILGAVRKTLIENHGEVESLLGSDGYQKPIV